MKKLNIFCKCNDERAFGFRELPSGDNYEFSKILSHLDKGMRVIYERRDDSSVLENIQNNFF